MGSWVSHESTQNGKAANYLDCSPGIQFPLWACRLFSFFDAFINKQIHESKKRIHEYINLCMVLLAGAARYEPPPSLPQSRKQLYPNEKILAQLQGTWTFDSSSSLGSLIHVMTNNDTKPKKGRICEGR